MQGHMAHEDRVVPSMRCVPISEAKYSKVLGAYWVAPNATVISDVKLDEQIEECNEKLTEMNKDFELSLTKLKDDPNGGHIARKNLSAELQSQFKEQAIY